MSKSADTANRRPHVDRCPEMVSPKAGIRPRRRAGRELVRDLVSPNPPIVDVEHLEPGICRLFDRLLGFDAAES